VNFFVTFATFCSIFFGFFRKITARLRDRSCPDEFLCNLCYLLFKFSSVSSVRSRRVSETGVARVISL